eukprot:CAMPEP_0206171592 /NCGR_PEP_ID=MMETSP1474-20131121/42965_1 /ASSEMBLY_ACC=CAM_ASM_001110 /TAXON_ID=97495 /ORGANISM="Imantonia sp., Strain RCC918" /LENGTH=99 /DNA_ID=CAMNT_0053579189 /DNA_START=54 /DNA_END=353 /DNA_ORIENTATION=+
MNLVRQAWTGTPAQGCHGGKFLCNVKYLSLWKLSVYMFRGKTCDQCGHLVAPPRAAAPDVSSFLVMSCASGTHLCCIRRCKSSTGFTCLRHMERATIGI